MRHLMWFRSDLRVTDNTALAEAASAAGGGGVVAVFCVCSKQWREYDWGAAKADFTLRNVRVLRDRLSESNIPLKILDAPRFKDVPKLLLRLANDVDANALYFNDEYEINERRRDDAVTEAFESCGLSVHRFHDQTIVPPDDLRTGAGRFYTVFSPYRKKWIEQVKPNLPQQLRYRPREQKKIDIVGDDVPSTLPGYDFDGLPREHWPAGEAEAMKRLKRFIDGRIDNYKRDRDVPAVDGTSTLSPYLASGVISPRQCLRAVLDANDGRLDTGGKGAVAWINELVWREFYRHVMWGFPRVCMYLPFRAEGRDVAWRDDEEAFGRWCRGETGVPIVDAAMRQLLAIGWMHNRLRMIVAMYLTKQLLIDWRKGEKFFMAHLIDGDLASNNGGWQWSASTGTDAAPYFRIFNPYTQGEKFDPDAKFVHRYCPELVEIDAKTVHNPEKWPPMLRSQIDYPPVIVEHAKGRERAIEIYKAALLTTSP